MFYFAAEMFNKYAEMESCFVEKQKNLLMLCVPLKENSLKTVCLIVEKNII